MGILLVLCWDNGCVIGVSYGWIFWIISGWCMVVVGGDVGLYWVSVVFMGGN